MVQGAKRGVPVDPGQLGGAVADAGCGVHEAGEVLAVQDAAVADEQFGAGLVREQAGRVCRARTRTIVLSWCFLRLSGCSPVLAGQAADDLPVRDPGGHIDRLAGFVQRRSLFPRLVRPVFVIVPRVLGQDPPEVPFAVDQQVVEALAA